MRIARIAELAVSGLLLYSGFLHAANPYRFASSVGAYRILPVELLAIVPFVLPYLMLALAMCLFLQEMTFAARLLAVMLFTAFAFAQSWALAHDIKISCGCFGHSLDPISVRSLAVPVLAGLSCAGMLLLDRAQQSRR